MAYETLKLDVEDGIATITLSRPEKLNAFNTAMLRDLIAAFDATDGDDAVKVVIVTGAGRAFCAGLDLKERNAQGNGERSVGASLTGQRQISEIVIAMRRCPQPIIACVDGAASGGGFALALASDVRIATPRTRMNAAFIRIGLSACDIGVSYFLPRMVGSSVAAEYMLTGRFIEAERAYQLGLGSRVVEPEAMAAEAQRFAADMLHATPLGLRLTKEALNHAIDAQGLEAAIAMEDRNQILASLDGDFGEGVAAFLEKRTPRYERREG